MLSCKDAHRLLVLRQDQSLGWRQRWSLRMHLAACSACRHFSGQMNFLHTAMRRYARKD